MRRVTPVILIEDDDNLRNALAQMIKMSNGLDLVADHYNVNDALHDVSETISPVVLLDVYLGDGTSSIDKIPTIKKVNSYARVLLLTGDCQPATIIKGFRAGADGYLLKEDAIMGLSEHIENLVRHDACVSPSVVKTLISIINNPMVGPTENTEVDLSTLTKKQMAVLQELVTGAPYEEMGVKLNMARNTVNQHVQRIYRKLGVKSRAQLMMALR